jgi:predicted RNA binding protein YcfA (HicA-like mRNA interferase family)
MGYAVTRQTGSHMRLTSSAMGEHHITIPNHSVLRVGTLSAILSEVGEHLKLPREKLIETLFG